MAVAPSRFDAGSGTVTIQSPEANAAFANTGLAGPVQALFTTRFLCSLQERLMRILLLCKKRGWSGETANIADLAIGCRNAGHDVVLGARPDAEIRRRLAKHPPTTVI